MFDASFNFILYADVETGGVVPSPQDASGILKSKLREGLTVFVRFGTISLKSEAEGL